MQLPAAQKMPESTSGLSFGPNSRERELVGKEINKILGTQIEIRNEISGRENSGDNTFEVRVPHDRHKSVGIVHEATGSQVRDAIESSLAAGKFWSNLPWEERAKPFERAAELIESSPWRYRLIAATMLELSKTSVQADGDVACENVDLLRMNIKNMLDMYRVQPYSTSTANNFVEYRPLEGFVLAISPFNFASTANLAFGPALLGNTVVWKPAESASLVSHLTMQLFKEAGLPDGVVNVLYGNGKSIGECALSDPNLAAVNFTGSTSTFRQVTKTVGQSIDQYRSFPRLVGETGGKDFIVAHSSADTEALAIACIRGAFEYQGQKCASASRLFVPKGLWQELKDRLIDLIKDLKMGDPTTPENYIGAVINQQQFRKHESALLQAKHEGLVLAGGNCSDEVGWFVEPTLLLVEDSNSRFLTEELFAPILSVTLYDESDWEKTLQIVDEATPFGLTGAVFARDEKALNQARQILRYTAGNYYENDKPTGATVGQQPFGGSRASGTNDKTGTIWNSIRFVSPRSVKQNLQPEYDYKGNYLLPNG